MTLSITSGIVIKQTKDVLSRQSVHARGRGYTQESYTIGFLRIRWYTVLLKKFKRYMVYNLAYPPLHSCL